MIKLEQKLGWYVIATLIITPVWVIAPHPTSPIAFLLGTAYGYGTAWWLMRRFEKLYRKAMLEAIAVLPEHPKLKAFRENLLEGIATRLPLLKMNRWLGYLEGQLVNKKLTTDKKIADDTRPLFRPLDFGGRNDNL